MFPAKFEYVSPTSVAEVLTLLEQGNGDAKIIAGGHSLLPLMKLRLAQPRLLIDIGRIPELRYIRVEGDQLVIGALATYRDIAQSEEVHRAMPGPGRGGAPRSATHRFARAARWPEPGARRSGRATCRPSCWRSGEASTRSERAANATMRSRTSSSTC